MPRKQKLNIEGVQSLGGYGVVTRSKSKKQQTRKKINSCHQKRKAVKGGQMRTKGGLMRTKGGLMRAAGTRNVKGGFLSALIPAGISLLSGLFK